MELTDLGTLTDDQLVGGYVQLRDTQAAERKKANKLLGRYAALLTQLENELQRRLNERGADNTKTPSGTAYKHRAVSVTTADKETFVNWVVENDLVRDMDVRPAKKYVEDYMERMGNAPPGLDVTTIVKINIRRS